MRWALFVCVKKVLWLSCMLTACWTQQDWREQLSQACTSCESCCQYQRDICSQVTAGLMSHTHVNPRFPWFGPQGTVAIAELWRCSASRKAPHLDCEIQLRCRC